jgi:flagellar biosynthesis/type III secretory pathway chaperone
MSIVENIKNILAEQTGSYRSLLAILERERDSLIHMNIAEIEALSKEKDTVVLKIRLLEEERIRLIGKYMNEQGITGDVSLQKIYEMTGDNFFSMLKVQLLSVLQGILELNEFNRILIERSLSFVKNSMNFLDSFGMDLKQKNTGVILSREI